MDYWEKLAELASATENILRNSGYTVERIEYPNDFEKRSIDIVAVRDGRPLLVKVAVDAGDLGASEMRELQGCSRVLRGAGFIVAEKDSGEEIDNIVAHEKMGVYVVSPASLEAALNSSIYVVKKQRNYYMKIDGARLRELRMEKGYSLGDIAQMLSVSRRSVYLYEQGETMVSLSVALKLMEIFGEEVFEPIDVIGAQLSDDRVKLGGRTRLGSALASSGFRVVETRRIPPNIVASGKRSRLIILVERKKEQDFERRLEESEKVARRLEAYVIALANEQRGDLGRGHDVLLVASIDEAVEIAGSLEEQESGSEGEAGERP